MFIEQCSIWFSLLMVNFQEPLEVWKSFSGTSKNLEELWKIKKKTLKAERPRKLSTRSKLIRVDFAKLSDFLYRILRKQGNHSGAILKNKRQNAFKDLFVLLVCFGGSPTQWVCRLLVYSVSGAHCIWSLETPGAWECRLRDIQQLDFSQRHSPNILVG